MFISVEEGEIAMSTKYEDPKLVPTSVLIERLKELADAIAKGYLSDYNVSYNRRGDCDD
jgi:hypothetical protein